MVLLGLVLDLHLHGVAFLLLLHPALGHVLALLGVLRVASLLVLSAADLRILSGTLLGGLSVASLSWLIPTLLRVLGLALLVVLLMALLGKLIFKYCLRKIYWRRRKSSPAHAQCGTSACRSSRTVPHTPFYTGDKTLKSRTARIESSNLSVVFSGTGSAVLGLALVLVLLHANLMGSHEEH